LALPGGDVLVTTNGATNTASLIDATSGKVLAAIATGKKPDAAIFDSFTGLVLVMNGDSGDVTLIDPKTRTSVGSIAIGGALEFAASDGAGKAFVNIEDKGEIAVLDLKARSVAGRYALKGCEEPSGLAYAKDAGVLIAACANGVAKAVRASDGKEVANLAIGKGPDATLYDDGRHLAFIPAGKSGALYVIAVRGPDDVAVIGSIATQPGARTGALDPNSGKIYLPTAKFAPATGGGRPAMIPGSFEVLVVAPK
jgi:DNA-binding beta-propeller fold protein YncE